ncbi:hypothetical protein F4859DRAFT_512793 [Xylaria cf. heliscus]|nr:hypothetical protein F4859DRAFT_512793 [Xylaria cf. heliscus]
MAPWSRWSQPASQPTSQQQQGQPEPPPSSPSPSTPPKTSSPLLTQAPTIPTTGPSGVQTNDVAHRDMPSPTELRQMAARSLQTGLITGGVGLVAGAGSGILRSAPPTLFALFTGFQWFALGSSYMASRDLLRHAWGGEENMSSPDFVITGGMAGGVSGLMGGLIRGPKNILPGILFFSTLGAGTSYVSQLAGHKDANSKTRWLDSKWSPMQRLSDKDYMEKIEEKILRLDAEIAIIDDNIASLKSSQSSVTSAESTTK